MEKHSVLIGIGEAGTQVEANRIVMISDSQVMVAETDADPNMHNHHVHSYELSDESANNLAERIMNAAPDVAFVQTSRRGGSYVNPLYIDDIYTNGLTLDVDPKDMARDVATTYTGTEMSDQIENAVMGTRRLVEKSARRLPDLSGIGGMADDTRELSME